ncbi:MAG: glycerol kinase, partial [Chloroflexi bacterium]
MSQAYILAIDQGTTNTKALLIDETGTIVSSASQQVQQSYPRSAWVEQDALEIWQSVQFVIGKCLEGQAVQQLAALAISNQRESIMLWERQSGTPLG